MHSKKYYIVYGLFFSLIVAAVLCLCLTIAQGVPHIDPVFWALSFAVAFVTSFIVTSILPLAKLSASCAVYFDAKPGSVAFRLIQNVFFSTLIMFFLGAVMTAPHLLVLSALTLLALGASVGLTRFHLELRRLRRGAAPPRRRPDGRCR